LTVHHPGVTSVRRMLATVRDVTVEQRLQSNGDTLTATERKIAEVVLSSPQVVAFGTVADVAAAADAGTATVVRLATKLGYDGFVALQRSIQNELSTQLLPAAERIRQLGESDLVGRHTAAEEGNVAGTLAGLDASRLDRVVALLADDNRPVRVLSGSSSLGVALQFVHDVLHLRSDVASVHGNQVDVLEELAFAPDNTVVVALDLRRYDRWLVEALGVASTRGFSVIALSDSVLSPLASAATESFVVEAASAGPFDSHVGTLALLNLFVAEVAVARRSKATQRLDRLEDAWTTHDALTD
jgi:DNA-binding MurR/RpiR family transcriptional regulator